MVTFTEGVHSAEFIISEANGHRSRENGTVVTGQNLAAGTVVIDNGAGKLTAFTGDTVTDGSLVDEAVGVIIAAADATSADVDVAYISRDAEVNSNLMTYPTDTGDEANMIASLALLGIVVRS